MLPKNFRPIRSRAELIKIAESICEHAEDRYPHLQGIQLKIEVEENFGENIWEFVANINGKLFVQKFTLPYNAPPFDSLNQLSCMSNKFLAYVNKEIGTVPDKALIDLLQELL